MVIDSVWFEPGSQSAADKEAAERTLQFTVSWYNENISLYIYVT